MERLSKYRMRLFELRRNPNQNPRQTPVEFLRQYKDNPTMYLHTTNVPKVGIYPRSSHSHDSPSGIYAYRLVDIWEDTIERWNTGDYKRGLEFLPYHGGDHLFILTSDIDPDFANHYTEDDLAQDIAKLQGFYRLSNERTAKLRRTATTNLNFRDIPAGYLWGMTKALAAGGISEFDQYTPTDTHLWNSILRRLGYLGFNDPGIGFIHGAEPTQALFLTTSAFKVVDHMFKGTRQPTVEIDDKKYKGGRLPKDLHMRSIPNTLFYNYEPKHFASVRTWTVDHMGLADLITFSRFVPWNAIGIVKTLSIGGAANESYEHSSVMSFFANHPSLPKNIKVENLYVGGRMPMMLIKLIPPTFDVKTITILDLAMRHGLETLPEPIKSKIRIQPLR